MAKIGG